MSMTRIRWRWMIASLIIFFLIFPFYLLNIFSFSFLVVRFFHFFLSFSIFHELSISFGLIFRRSPSKFFLLFAFFLFFFLFFFSSFSFSFPFLFFSFSFSFSFFFFFFSFFLFSCYLRSSIVFSWSDMRSISDPVTEGAEGAPTLTRDSWDADVSLRVVDEQVEAASSSCMTRMRKRKKIREKNREWGRGREGRRGWRGGGGWTRM